MRIKKIYIGGWFQRTMLHLTEIYDFLGEGTSGLDLDSKKLLELREKLEIEDLHFGIDGFEYVAFSSKTGVNVKIFEDGLIILNDKFERADVLQTEIDRIAEYYETKLSPAISYLFSLGAPIPKELASIKTVYPYFIVLDNATKETMQELLESIDKQKYYEYNNKNFDVLRGDKYFFINIKKEATDKVEKYIEEQIFIREFKGQLHRYLNLHRIIWEKVEAVKDKVKIRGKDIIKFSSEIEGYAKTINLVETRINQMGAYLKTRETIAKDDEDFKDFFDIMEYSHETLGDTLTYVQQVWVMTKNYVDSAKDLFNDLQSRVTEKSLENLTIVVSLGAIAALMDLFSVAKMPEFTINSFLLFFAFIFVVGYVITKIMKFVSSTKKYEISDVEYEKFEDK